MSEVYIFCDQCDEPHEITKTLADVDDSFGYCKICHACLRLPLMGGSTHQLNGNKKQRLKALQDQLGIPQLTLKQWKDHNNV